MLVARPFERGLAAKNTRADLYGDECDEYVGKCFRHLEAPSTFTSQLCHLQKCISAFASRHWRVCSNCQRETVLQCFLFFATRSSNSLRKPKRRRPTSSPMKNIITVSVERSISPTMVPATFHWQETCGIYDISFQIFMYVTCTLAKQSGGTILLLRIVEHMTKEPTDPFHHRDHLSNDRFQRNAVRITEVPAY